MKIQAKGFFTWGILSLIIIMGFLALGGSHALAAAPNWDTRACLMSPDNDNCTGKLPTASLDVPASTAMNGGSGACLNDATQSIATPINDISTLSSGGTQTHLVGTLEIWWLQSCKSYAAKLSIPQLHALTMTENSLYISPTVKITMTSHDIDTSQDTSPLDNFFGIQSQYSRDESTGPVASYDTWTPMIWSSGGVASVCASITFESGLSFSPNCMAASMVNGKLSSHQMIDAWVRV